VTYVSPKALKRGDNVAIIAPASPFKSDELVAGLDIVRECGLEPVLGPNVRRLRTIDIHAAPLMERVEELMWAYTDPSISGVITVTGGMGCGETLPYLDFGAIRRSRRVLLGISDITALNNGILSGAELITINGQYPSIRVDKGDSVREADSESLRTVLDLMMSGKTWHDEPFRMNQQLPRTVSPGRASGHVIGGNLDTFCTLIGTPFLPRLDGAVLFIEDVYKQGEAIARLLIHCKLAGVFDRIAGIVVGEFIDVPKKEEAREPSIDDVIQQYLSNGPPCSFGYSFSHGDITIPIPIGSQCEMDADTGEVSFDFSML